MSVDTVALIVGGVAAITVVSTLAGVLIGKWIFFANAQHHRGLRQEHGSRHSDPQGPGRLSGGGKISDVSHYDFSRKNGSRDHG